MRTLPLLFVALAYQVVSFTPVFADTDDGGDDRGLVIFYCSRCHKADQYYLSERSKKSWELTVKRMQSYYYDYEPSEAFSDEQAEQIIEYLAKNPFSHEAYKPRSGKPALSAPTAGELAAKAKLTATKALPAAATGPAKIMGYIATAALALMVLTGLMRRRFGLAFRNTHSVLAFIFCGSLTVHAIVFLAEYGAPAVLWLWFGIIATVILLASEFTGLLHLQNRKLFVKFHTAAGVLGLILTAAHWAWIYI